MIDALVTGAGGFVGRALVARLKAEGRDVLALDRAAGEVEDAATWEALPAARCVYHLAARTYVPDSWRDKAAFIKTNVMGTEQALAYCRQHGARLIYLSAYVYGIPQNLPIAEEHSVSPNNPYALSKHLAEQLCAFAAAFQGVDVTVLRPFNIYGVGQRSDFLIPTIIEQVKRGDVIRVKDLAPRRDYVYIDDVVEAMVKAAACPSGYHVLNIGSGQSSSVEEIIATVQRVAGTSFPVYSEEQVRAQEIPDVVADVRLAKDVLGWSPRTSFEEGIRNLIRMETA
ncbi:MAG: NAD(P)-dependent oxidoreductase [Bdellovibrionales bacterium]|jgi:nucleoside-diphosphate-sugar epimerase